MTDNDIVLKISRKLRQIRQDRNLTIQRLAERAGVSKSLLSKIENAKTVPSLPVFIHILQSLDISFIDFFEEITKKSEQNYWLIKKPQYNTVHDDRAHGVKQLHLFTKAIPSSKVDVSVLILRPGSKSQPLTSGGLKFKYLITGTCECHVNNEILTLHAGDSLYLLASVQHCTVNKSNEDANLFVITFYY